jgi:hypothetical protein
VKLSRCHAVALGSAIALTTPTWSALAADSSAAADTSERARFKAAQELYDKGNFAGALPLFRAIPSPNAHLYAARCLVGLKQLPEAYEELSATIREATERALTEQRYAATRDAAATERTALASKIGLVVIAVTDRPAGIVVTIGGRVVPADHLGEAFPVAPGPVLVEATAPGRVAFQRRLAIGAGASEVLAIALVTATAVAKAPPPITTHEKIGGGVRTGGFVVAGVGVAGLATFAITGLLANSKYSSVSAACGGTHCTDPAYQSQIDAGKTLDTVANIGLGVGLAGLVGGTLMIVFGGAKEAPVAVAASPDGARLFVRGTF